MQVVIRSTRGYGVENGVKMLVYGRAGRGKTTLCATCPAPIVFSAESGLLALDKYDIPYIQINTMADLRNAYEWAKGSHESRQFQTICLDSISEIGEKCLLAAGAGKKDGRMIYGDMMKEMTEIIKNFRDLSGRHVYMSAKQGNVESGGTILCGPSMPGKKMGESMPYFPDEVFQLDIDPVGQFRFLRCQPDYANDAKDRSGMLGPMEEPHLGKIIQKILTGVGQQQPR